MCQLSLVTRRRNAEEGRWGLKGLFVPRSAQPKGPYARRTTVWELLMFLFVLILVVWLTYESFSTIPNM